MSEVVKVSPVLVELARQQVQQLEAAGRTPPVALLLIAQARSVARTNLLPLASPKVAGTTR